LSSASSPIPTIRCDGKSWQAIWDELDQSSYQSLKCRNDFQAKMTSKPTMKQLQWKPQRPVCLAHIKPPKIFKNMMATTFSPRELTRLPMSWISGVKDRVHVVVAHFVTSCLALNSYF
jgi:hypothetical protein